MGVNSYQIYPTAIKKMGLALRPLFSLGTLEDPFKIPFISLMLNGDHQLFCNFWTENYSYGIIWNLTCFDISYTPHPK